MSGYTKAELKQLRMVRAAERARRAGGETTIRAIDCLSDRPRLVLIQGGKA